jgi:hypothetical protein
MWSYPYSFQVLWYRYREMGWEIENIDKKEFEKLY